VTMTTVGYGDMYPTTGIGKIIAVPTMLAGILIFALPITVIGSNYETAYHNEVRSA
jgi:potassium voltage-gated channel Shaker-related subfamily A protein 1